MSTPYAVRQGDYLAKIAHDHGFNKWQTIYEHPDNQAFRQKRPDPNVIYPGDQLFIPDKKPSYASAGSDQKRTFKRRRSATPVRLVLKNGINNDPVVILKYELATKQETFTRLRGQSRSPTFDPKNLERGMVVEKLAHPETEATLKLWLRDEKAPDPEFEYTLKLGDLDPVEEITGVQARLNNLGFHCGAIDGNCGPKTQAALKAFQGRYGLTVDCQPNKETQAKLKELYGF
jgi:putative peptidoglycan binding protein